MDFLKEYLGDELYSQVAPKIKGLKLVNLADGDYVSKAKYDDLNSKLEEANNKLILSGNLEEKLQSLSKENEELKVNSEKDLIKISVNAELKLNKAKDLKVLNPLLDYEKIKLTDGKLDGLSEQLDIIKTTHGYLFETPPVPIESIPQEPEAIVITPTNGGNPPSGGKEPKNLYEALKMDMETN